MRIIILLFLILSLGFSGVVLKFDEVDIKTVAVQVAKLLGKNLVIDPRVKGKITIISNGEISESEALELFSQALASQGFSLILEKDTMKIVPASQGYPFTEIKAGKGGEFVTLVYKLKNTNASQVVSALRPFLSPYGRIAFHAQSNSVIITDYADSVNKVKKILFYLDSGGGEVRVYKLKYVKPSYVVKLLNPFSTLSTKRYGEPVVIAGVDEMNAVAVYANKEIHRIIEKVISDLDDPSSLEAERSFYIIPLNFVSAEEIYESLNSVFKGIKSVSVGTKKAKKGKGVQALTSITLKSGMKIGFDKRTNSLILYATKSEYEAVREFIKKIDKRRKQLLLTATIIEASAKSILEAGIRWQILGTHGGAAFKGSSLQDVYNAIKSGNFVIGGFSKSGTTVSIGGIDFFFPDLVFLFSLLEQGTGFNVVSNPKILTLDNQEALIKVGQVVPFPTGIKYDVNGNPIITYDYKDVGLELKITPRITGETVRLVIELKLQEITGYLTNEVSGVNYTVPITSNRELNSDVVVENGRTVVIGGLISRKSLKSTEKIPGLGDIPVMGRLFRYDRDEKDKTSLFIFLTPYVITSPQELAKLTQEHEKLARELMKALKKKEEKKVEVEEEDWWDEDI
ncbi:type II secretion system secretin GspD [Aquifex aeolicus]|uniref:General secretion pathway protein D n=1 Tax=Aquifex aeolicus (strain VF5) TaxID=224324 RepID=O67320_AQUAE|nr:type II secretion system secretin GspD [Aquifex aeolicus]AAC07271.1 general secretion pathway protein D [Aquifex aeolicus VF5]